MILTPAEEAILDADCKRRWIEDARAAVPCNTPEGTRRLLHLLTELQAAKFRSALAMVQAGAMTKNELRSFLVLPPIAGGDAIAGVEDLADEYLIVEGGK